jgi:hypothetical protein
MPGQRILLAGDKAGAALQATLIVYDDFTLFVQCVQVGRADMQTVSDCAAGLANLLVDPDMWLFSINLENVQPELGFNIQRATPTV